MLKLEPYLNILSLSDGIWTSTSERGISYPAEANNNCFEIEDQSFWFRNRNRIILEEIQMYSMNGPFFDVGGGNGFVTDHLSKNGVESILVEPGLDGCLNGKRRGLKYIINSFLDTEHFSAGKIPNIGIFDVLEHIEDQDKFLGTVNTLLVQDGRLFITVPSFKMLWSKEDEYAGHFRRYSKKELEKALSNHGFEIMYSSYFFSFLFLPVFFLRAIPSKIGIYRSDFSKTKKQHTSSAFSTAFLGLAMKYELRKIRGNKPIKIGSSLIVVAKKR